MLSVRDLVTTYGKIEALKGVSLEVREGSITCVLGPNGAIEFRGEPIGALSAHAIVARGVALVPENRLVFPHMSVLENLHAGAYQRRDPFGADIERLFARFPRLKERASQDAGTLSGGEQQMLAIGRALMSKPKLLMLDEPSLGLAPILVETIFQIVREINGQGIPILLVEQNAHKALEVAHRAYVLETGSIVKTGSGKELLDSPDVQRAYLGI
jgi:branched-chain amino acid transport system ATP-binding protein